MGLLRGSERKAEDRPLSRDALAPHAPAVATHDALHGGEPESAPGEFLPGMEPFEGLENYLTLRVVEADPIVSHVVDRDTPLAFDDAQLDPCVLGRSGVLPCIL